MKMKMRTVRVSQSFRQVFVISALVGLFAPLLHAQEIHIRVLNARNGKPITDECVNVWIGTSSGAHLLAATNSDGVAMLHIAENELLAEVACRGWPVRASRPVSVDTITISGDNYVTCQEYGKIVPGEPMRDPVKELMPSYSVKKILQLGVTAGNTCGKFRVEAKPGELIFFVRPRTWLEKLKL